MLEVGSSTPTLTPPAPASAKIDTVNHILRQDSADFERQYGSPYAASPVQVLAQAQQAFPRPAQRSRTLPLGATLVMGKTIMHDLDLDLELGAEERLDDGKAPTTAPMPVLLNFAQSPIDLDEMDVDIELHSAKYPGPRRPSATASRPPSSASSVFNHPPGLMTSSPLSAEMAWSLSKQHVDLRANPEVMAVCRSRSSSTSSTATITAGTPDDIDWRRPKSNSGLNAFAPPWPLPNTTPQLSQAKAIPKSAPQAVIPPPAARAESTTLPPPASLPRKPQGSLPPVFVKREAALLPQGMALPHVAPMGGHWEGENGLSGNDKRRRAGEQGSVPGSRSINRAMSNVSLASAGSERAGSLPSSGRPDQLVRLGRKLRENASRPII